jgi:hypothetical protein
MNESISATQISSISVLEQAAKRAEDIAARLARA